MTRPTDHPTRITIGSGVLVALAVVSLPPLVAFVVAPVIFVLGYAACSACALFSAIANADRDCARQQSQAEPFADRPSVIFVSNHEGACK